MFCSVSFCWIFTKSSVTMETIFDEDEIDDNMDLIKLERGFTISRDSENVFCLYRVCYESVVMVSGTDKLPSVPEIFTEDSDDSADDDDSDTGNCYP